MLKLYIQLVSCNSLKMGTHGLRYALDLILERLLTQLRIRVVSTFQDQMTSSDTTALGMSDSIRLVHWCSTFQTHGPDEWHRPGLSAGFLAWLACVVGPHVSRSGPAPLWPCMPILGPPLLQPAPVHPDWAPFCCGLNWDPCAQSSR